MAAKRKGPIKKEAKGLTESARDTIDVYGMVLESSINDLLEGALDALGLATKKDIRAIGDKLTAIEKKLGARPARKKAAKRKTAKKKSKKSGTEK